MALSILIIYDGVNFINSLLFKAHMTGCKGTWHGDGAGMRCGIALT